MGRMFGSFALVLTIIVLLSVSFAAEGEEFDYFQLVLQYQVNVCATTTSRPCCRAPNPVFSLHGLWPSNYSSTVHIVGCVGSPFNVGMITRRRRGQILDQYWPDLLDANTNVNFWRNEWNRHGTCSETYFKQDVYFDLAASLAKQVIDDFRTNNIVGTQASTAYPLMENKVFHAIGQYPVLRCLNNLLTEIVVCVEKQGLNLVDCRSIVPRTRVKCPPYFTF